ncbi:DnaB-like helicase C-terminal domain-containing protein [Streptomyces subrutilus]|uniref:DnaB-like helicase C-terminal domain-containing protein n=1 Tax=Streptomyces subrutilus TaxID=36818 RepID=UPI00344A1C45
MGPSGRPTLACPCAVRRARPGRPGARETVRRSGTELFRSLPLRVFRPDGAGLGDIAAAARTCARGGGLALLVVDCLQLVEAEQSRSITREQAVASVSRGLKNLSVQLGCHVIALSQLNDDGIMREFRAIKNSTRPS